MWLMKTLGKLGSAGLAEKPKISLSLNLPPSMTGYRKMAKHFSESEVRGLNQELVDKLDRMRDIAGIPIVITCGVRTSAENAALPDSAPDSAHLSGHAADIRCQSSEARYQLLKGAFGAALHRIEIGTAHIHVDNDPSKPQEVCWLGKSN